MAMCGRIGMPALNDPAMPGRDGGYGYVYFVAKADAVPTGLTAQQQAALDRAKQNYRDLAPYESDLGEEHEDNGPAIGTDVFVISLTDAATAAARVANAEDPAGRSQTVELTFLALGVNDAPQAGNTDRTVDEGSDITLAAADFGFQDDDAGDRLKAVRLTEVGEGRVRLDDAQTDRREFTEAALDAGQVKLRWDADAVADRVGGPPDLVMRFRVQDQHDAWSDEDAAGSWTISFADLNNLPPVFVNAVPADEDARAVNPGGTVTVDEGAAGAHHLFTARAMPEQIAGDGPQPVMSYELQAADGGAFLFGDVLTIDADDGEVRLARLLKFTDLEALATSNLAGFVMAGDNSHVTLTFSVLATATHASGSTTERHAFALRINNLAESDPQFVGDGREKVDEGSIALGGELFTARATVADVPGAQGQAPAPAYALHAAQNGIIKANLDSLLQIDTETGAVSLKPDAGFRLVSGATVSLASFDFETLTSLPGITIAADGSYLTISFVIRATAPHPTRQTHADQTVTLQINNLDDNPPLVRAFDAPTFEENNFGLVAVSATDADNIVGRQPTDTITYGLAGTDDDGDGFVEKVLRQKADPTDPDKAANHNHLVQIDAATGRITFKDGVFDYEYGRELKADGTETVADDALFVDDTGRYFLIEVTASSTSNLGGAQPTKTKTQLVKIYVTNIDDVAPTAHPLSPVKVQEVPPAELSQPPTLARSGTRTRHLRTLLMQCYGILISHSSRTPHLENLSGVSRAIRSRWMSI